MRVRLRDWRGEPVTTARLRSDAEAKPDLVAIGDLTMLLIRRGQREEAIRLLEPLGPSFEVAATGAEWVYPTRFEDVRPGQELLVRRAIAAAWRKLVMPVKNTSSIPMSNVSS